MIETVEAVFDGKVLHPQTPLSLPPNTRVRLVVESVEAEAAQPASFLRTARALQLNGPEDWATNLDAYLYEQHERDEPSR